MTSRWLSRAERIATVSAFSKRELMAACGVDGDRIEVIHNGVGELFRPVSSCDQEEVRARYSGGCDYFLHLGSIHPRKNVANLLRAFDRFKQRSACKTKLLLAGRLAWMYDEVLRTHAAMEHRNDVVFLGYVPERELPGLLAAARALVCVSFYEGFGLPVVEAMACAVPVIASARAALPEVAGEAALYAQPDDPDSIASAMEQMVGDAELRGHLTRLGLQRVGQFSWDASAAAVWRILTRIAAGEG